VYLVENTRHARQAGIEAYRPDLPVTNVQLVRCLCCWYAVVLMLSICQVFPQSFQVHFYTEDGGLPSSTDYDAAQDSSGPRRAENRSGSSRDDLAIDRSRRSHGHLSHLYLLSERSEDGITLPVNVIVPWNDEFYVATGNGLAVINETKVDRSRQDQTGVLCG